MTKNLSDQTSYRIEQRFDEMMRTNPRYKNLDQANQKIILDLIAKYKAKKIHGIKPSGLTVREDLYHLYENRLKLGLTYNDLDQIKDLLTSFKD